MGKPKVVVDIALCEKIGFSVMVLDEAQYIKNQKAAMTKAVKAVRAEHRLALTGTTIENRLAELWSIFDFLMPGFLYGYSEFSRRFETPITKNHDQATDRAHRIGQAAVLTGGDGPYSREPFPGLRTQESSAPFCVELSS